ncbi:MAG: outer membrane beta-barrel protein [Campylobacterota bacterium]|nr:outer membrane beta-barrel protein [Campylobacterota bacterium]
MFKKLLLLSLLTCLKLFAAPNTVYVELEGGIGLEDGFSTKTDDYAYDSGFVGSIAVGYQLDSYRLELEGRYSKDKLYSMGNYSASGDLIKNSQMLNAYYSFYNHSKLITTLGAGVGITSIELNDLVEFNTPQKDLKNRNILSYQALFSVGYMITDSVIISLKYRYFYTAKSDDFNACDDNIFTLSLRYLF